MQPRLEKSMPWQIYTITTKWLKIKTDKDLMKKEISLSQASISILQMFTKEIEVHLLISKNSNAK
jgi:hypothetical protein